MNNAIFVSLNETYPQLTPDAQKDPRSSALRNCTTNSWLIDIESAKDVEWVFGVFHTRIVSVYRVPVCARDWSIVPNGAVDAGRKIIPTEAGDPARFMDAMAFPAVHPNRAVGYGEVDFSTGRLVPVRLP